MAATSLVQREDTVGQGGGGAGGGTASATNQVTGNTSLASIDGKLPTAAASADAVANPSPTLLGAFVSGYNGATWDRVRTGAFAIGTTATGALQSMGLAVFNATPTTRTEGQFGPQQTSAKGSLMTLDEGGNLALVAAGVGTIRHATTPTKADVATGQIEVAKTGVVYVGASLRHNRKLVVATTAASAYVGFASLAEGACDALRVDTDSTIVYHQAVERAPLVVQTSAAWGGGSPPSGWTVVGTVFTHSAGTTPIVQDTATSNANDPIIGADYYAVVYTAVVTAGSVQCQIGTTLGTARTASGTYLEIVQAVGGTVTQISFVPLTTFTGSIDVSTTWAFAGSLPIAVNSWEPFAAIKVVALAASATPGTVSATARVAGGWYRRPGAVELT